MKELKVSRCVCQCTMRRSKAWSRSRLLEHGCKPSIQIQTKELPARSEVEKGLRFLDAFQRIRKLIAPYSVREKVEILGVAALKAGMPFDDVKRALGRWDA